MNRSGGSMRSHLLPINPIRMSSSQGWRRASPAIRTRPEMRATERVALRVSEGSKSTPSRVGSSEGEVRVLSGHSGKTLALLGRTRTGAVRRAGAGARWSVGWELGSRWGDIRRTPIPTTERELEQRKDDQHVHAIRGRLTGRTPGSEPGNGIWVQLPPPEPSMRSRRRGRAERRQIATLSHGGSNPSDAFSCRCIGVVAETVQAPG
jgi:hypothetical protein